ncbi:uncharacterized protein LOC128601511 isoform X2 [Ictalurus furcatus]|uniref:uncharacterized protein LOC128601511 isoform X2 n=1 Tax=Ictalurus furcatus TaxID=66913 RepID=UPI002350DCE8|nr:uncharacterized protein LOC128601511 isoform X2 [Ictalurus furcatus]
MITLFVALYSLFSLCTAVKTSDIKELHVKTVKRGENVTMECSMSKVKNKYNLAWYRQSFGKLPQYFVRHYSSNSGYTFVDEFEDSRFSMTVNDQKFDLNIIGTREDDAGEYLCGEMEGNKIKFTSGTRLQFEGSNEGSKSSDGKGSSCSDQMHVLVWLSIFRVGVLAFMLLIFPIILIVFKLRSN